MIRKLTVDGIKRSVVRELIDHIQIYITPDLFDKLNFGHGITFSHHHTAPVLVFDRHLSVFIDGTIDFANQPYVPYNMVYK